MSAINACLDLNDNGTIVHVCNQAMADATGPNYLIVQHGDSGGPVYKLAGNPNYALAAGIVSGGSSDGLIRKPPPALADLCPTSEHLVKLRYRFASLSKGNCKEGPEVDG